MKVWGFHVEDDLWVVECSECGFLAVVAGSTDTLALAHLSQTHGASVQA